MFVLVESEKGRCSGDLRGRRVEILEAEDGAAPADILEETASVRDEFRCPGSRISRNDGQNTLPRIRS
jgi:hypothetical protein